MRIEAADVPKEQSAAKPWLRWKRLKSRFVCCRCTRVDVVENALEDHPLLSRLAGDRREIVDCARIEFREHAPNAVAQKVFMQRGRPNGNAQPHVRGKGRPQSHSDGRSRAKGQGHAPGSTHTPASSHGFQARGAGKPTSYSRSRTKH